jgi:hypothetical protein
MTDYLCLHISHHCDLHLVRTHRDYEGTPMRTLLHVTQQKGMGYDRVEYDGGMARPLKLVGASLIIPCAQGTMQRVIDFLEMQHLMAKGHAPRGPYYFTMDMTRRDRFENRETGMHLIGGEDTAYAGKLQDGIMRRAFNAVKNILWAPETGMPSDNEEGISFARYNCWTGVQGVVEHVAGIRLEDFGKGLSTIYRAEKAMNETHKIFRRVDAGASEYETIKIAPSAFITRRNGGAPFIIAQGSHNLSELLDTRPGDGAKTAEQLIEDMGVAAPKRLSAPPQPLQGPAP